MLTAGSIGGSLEWPDGRIMYFVTPAEYVRLQRSGQNMDWFIMTKGFLGANGPVWSKYKYVQNNLDALDAKHDFENSDPRLEGAVTFYRHAGE